MAITFSPRPGIFFAAVAVLSCLVLMKPALAADIEIEVVPEDAAPDLSEPQTLRLTAGKSVVLKSPEKLKRVSEPDTNVVQREVISPHEVYLVPRSAGTTNLILWFEDEMATVYELKVSYDLSRLKERLYELFPDESELRVMSTHDSITLSGRVSSSSTLDQILAVTEAFAPEDKIRNLVEVGGVHQVMLEVTVAEVSRESLKRMGVDFSLVHEGGEFALGFLGSRLGGRGDADGLLRLETSADRTLQWTSIFDMLQEEGLAEILAEPSLIALSGQTASFLAGGEFPIPERDADGEIGSVDFRPYGVELAFTPTVLSRDRIAINVVPVVSELDPASGTEVLGSFVPATNVRRAETTVELGDGQSFAIAGLLSESTGEVISKFPGLGDLPILGNLFTSKRFQQEKTELVIMITPRLVRPIVAEEQHLPTDFYIQPDDAEFYLWGVFGRSHEHMPTRGNATFDGEFGHVFVR